MPAFVQDDPGSEKGNQNVLIHETTQSLITLLNAVQLDIKSKDGLQPPLYEAVTFLSKVLSCMLLYYCCNN